MRELYHLAVLSAKGERGAVKKSGTETLKLLMQAANLGFARAHSSLSQAYRRGRMENIEIQQDHEKALHHATLAWALDRKDGLGALSLGVLYFLGTGVERSNNLALYYGQQATTLE